VSGSADALEMRVKIRLRVGVRPQGPSGARFAEDVTGVGEAPLATREARDVEAAIRRLAERTAADLAQAYAGRQKLWSADAQALARALAASDTDVRVEAMRVAGARRLRELVPAVVRLLGDEDENVRDAALGTLVAMGERSAIKALADSRQMRDAREMRKVLDAIASLGGREAKDYLGFVAETHDDEEIRVMAKEALGRLERRAATK